MQFLQHSATFVTPSSNQSFDMALCTSFTADFSWFCIQIFCHEKDPVHTEQVSIAKLRELKSQLLPHQAYIPDLALSDFHLLGHSKILLVPEDFGIKMN